MSVEYERMTTFEFVLLAYELIEKECEAVNYEEIKEYLAIRNVQEN